jgi:Zn-dependent protease with chaperone function
MFLPFLLYLVAMTAATLSTVAPQAAAAADVWRGSLALALPWLAGWLLGLVSERWMGSRGAMRIGRRRWFALAIWLGTVTLSPLVPALMAVLAPLKFGTEIALAALLVHYWIADSLALQPPHLLGSEGAAAPARGFFQVLRVPTPFLVLVMMGLGISSATQGLLDGRGADPDSQTWWAIVVPTLFYVASAAVAMPVLLRVCWGLRRLQSKEGELAIHDELKANGVRGVTVLAWPEQLTGYATAGVIGIVPGFRYLLFSETLAVGLTEAEIRSITAHEAAHLKHRHLWFYFAAIFAAVLLIQVFWKVIFLAGLWMGVEVPFWAIAIVELAALLVFLRAGWGFLSRHFERQADGDALRRGGLSAFQSAIAKVALINGIPVDQANWHHHGIGERVHFLRQAQDTDPAVLTRHDRTVRRLKLLTVALLAVAIGAQWFLEASPLSQRVVENYWEQKLAQAGGPVLADLPGLQELAMLAYRRHDLARAEHLYRQILSVTPDDPQIQNNLAWLLVTRPNASAETLREGLLLAQKASAKERAAYILDTLAEAYARVNQPERAREAAQAALDLAEAGKGRGEASLSYYRERVLTVGAKQGARWERRAGRAAAWIAASGG